MFSINSWKDGKKGDFNDWCMNTAQKNYPNNKLEQSSFEFEKLKPNWLQLPIGVKFDIIISQLKLSVKTSKL